MTNQRPILFSTAMVQAILAGRKTQTRRVVKIQPGEGEYYEYLGDGEFAYVSNGGISGPYKCPYGNPGDKEWQTGMPPTDGYYYVKNEFDGKPVFLRPCRNPEFDEEFITWGWTENDDPEDISSDGGPTIETIQWKRQGDVLWVREACTWVMRDHAPDLLEGQRDSTQWVYKASVHDDFMKYAKERYGYKWKPSIHMPKEAARIWLRITNVRVERLQDISEDDAIAEGVEKHKEGWKAYNVIENGPHKGKGHPWNVVPFKNAYHSFESLWQSINGEQSWNDDPWVWVVQFEIVEKPNN